MGSKPSQVANAYQVTAALDGDGAEQDFSSPGHDAEMDQYLGCKTKQTAESQGDSIHRSL